MTNYRIFNAKEFAAAGNGTSGSLDNAWGVMRGTTVCSGSVTLEGLNPILTSVLVNGQSIVTASLSDINNDLSNYEVSTAYSEARLKKITVPFSNLPQGVFAPLKTFDVYNSGSGFVFLPQYTNTDAINVYFLAYTSDKTQTAFGGTTPTVSTNISYLPSLSPNTPRSTLKLEHLAIGEPVPCYVKNITVTTGSAYLLA
jgi:hypothetical protein